jgi:hypothetical protein
LVPSDQAIIQAASITAAATRQAAYVQAAAGLAVVVAAFVAGRSAYKSATRQVRLQESQAEARADAYKFMLSLVAQDLLAQAAVEYSEARSQLDRHGAGRPPEVLTGTRFTMPPELKPDNWQDHAMLGIAAVRAIRYLHEALTEAMRFNQEMRGKQWYEISDNPTLGNATNEPDGGVSFARDIGVENHYKVADELLKAAKNLATILSNPTNGGAGMKRDIAYSTAVSMLKREHPRWSQNALVLFGSLISVLLLYKDFKEIVALWLLFLICFGISAMTVLVALSIRRSTDAWNDTLCEIGKLPENADVQTFELFEKHRIKHNPLKDFLCWNSPLSVTRLYTLAAILMAIFFGVLSAVTFCERTSKWVTEFRQDASVIHGNSRDHTGTK